MRPAVAGNRNDCTRDDLDGVRVEHTVIRCRVDTGHRQACVFQQQFDDLVERLDVGQGGHQRAATINFAGHFHVARDHPRRHLATAVDDLRLGDFVDNVIAVVAALVVVDRGLKQFNVICRLVFNLARHVIGNLGIRPLALDALALHAHAPVDVVHLTVGSLFVGDQEERHRHKI